MMIIIFNYRNAICCWYHVQNFNLLFITPHLLLDQTKFDLSLWCRRYPLLELINVDAYSKVVSFNIQRS